MSKKVTWESLSQMVVVRNHLSLLINSGRSVIPKNDVNAVNARMTTLDKFILEQAQKLIIEEPTVTDLVDALAETVKDNTPKTDGYFVQRDTVPVDPKKSKTKSGSFKRAKEE